ncbi:MAG: HNH endonuclease [Gammaproteobacteria bacterium]|nr:HNH endonuclease [Gammaproteobacteria bacterium]
MALDSHQSNGVKMRRNRNDSNIVSGGPAIELISTVERFVYSSSVDENETLMFDEIDLKNIALQSGDISVNTALHKVLDELAYNQFYLYSYDDTDWCGDINDFAEYAIDMFQHMNLEVPEKFQSTQESKIYEAKQEYDEYFLSGLQNIIISAFAHLWQRKGFLLDFNLKLSEEVKLLQKDDYPQLAKDGQIARATYFPKWLMNLLLHRERGLCHYCGNLVASPSVSNQEYDIDHMVPIAQGGTNDPTNLALSCPGCNNQKRAEILIIQDTFAWPKRI